jgi:hypothetical protein
LFLIKIFSGKNVMPIYKFKNFLSDPQVYAEAEKYWYDLFRSILATSEKKAQWKKWFDTSFLDGTPIRDGNPIYSMVSHELRKGVRIIQDEPDPSCPEIVAWMGTFGDYSCEECIEELVISCVLSDETEKVARKLIYAFVVDNLPRQEMEKLIGSLNGHVSDSPNYPQRTDL